MCSQNLSLSKNGRRCRSLQVVLIAVIRFNALTSSLKFSRCVCNRCGSTHHVCCCSDNSCLIGEFAVLDQNMFSFSGLFLFKHFDRFDR